MSDTASLRPPEPVAVLELFPEERAELLALLERLPAEEWHEPTVCPGWSVHDVALHLLGVDLGNVSSRRDGWEDPYWATAGGDLVSALEVFNGRWVIGARRLSPSVTCELLRVSGQMVARYLASLDLTALGGPVTWVGPDPAPVWLDVAREYTERWVHQQQIRDAVRRPGLKEPRYFAPVLATFVHALPRALGTVLAPPGTALRLIVSGEAGGRWLAVRGERGWHLRQDRPAVAAAATATLEADIAWRLWTRGITAEEAGPRLILEGDPVLAEAVMNMVSIIA